MPGLLEVAVHHDRDVPGAVEGGADRLSLSVPGHATLLSPDVPTAAAVIRASDVPVRVRLRLNDSTTTTGGEFTRLVGLAEEYLALGAEGVEFGFLDPDLRIDVATCAALAERLRGVPWTFHSVFDDALEPRRAWRDVAGLTGITAVCSAGSPQGLAVGFDELVAQVGDDASLATLALAGDGLTAEQVPWLSRVGVSQVRLSAQARPGGSSRAYVDAALVRSWRLLLDDAVERAS